MFWRRLPRPWAVAVDWLVTIGAAIAFVLVFEAEVAKPYRIPTASMEPTLHCAQPEAYCRARVSDRIVANRLAFRFRSPRRGEVVVFQTPPATEAACGRGGVFVKRIVGLPGETISERSGRIFVNGQPLSEPYVDPRDRDSETRTFPRVPTDSYLLMGDNRSHSCDSRTWGAVPRANLIGPVLVRYWPLWRIPG
jgi:signal peptidase I